MDHDDHAATVFLDIQRGLPQQGPGDDASTLRALELCAELPPRPDVLDIGCGPGRQTLALAKARHGRISAVDLHAEYLGQLVRSAEAAGLKDRIEIVEADMAELPFGDDSFDLIWSEGAAYILGFETALEQWHRYLRPGGYIGVTELVWLTDDPPAEVAEFFGSEYPEMAAVDDRVGTFAGLGYEIIGHFTLPDAAWWDGYYTPLEAKLPGLRARYADDAVALALVESTAREIDIRRRFGDTYGYEFFVARAPRDDPRDVS